MQIKFWGVWGSLPVPGSTSLLRDKVSRILTAAQGLSLDDDLKINEFLDVLPPHLTHLVGGNTTCVEVATSRSHLILDAGSGLKNLGLRISDRLPLSPPDYPFMDLSRGRKFREAARPNPKAPKLNFLISHTHWDHLQGLPFFAPAYMPDADLTFYGLEGAWLEEAFRHQQRAPRMFPVALGDMAAKLTCLSFPQGELRLGDLVITSFPLPHPGGCLAYRIRQGRRSVVYATDYEFKNPDSPQAADFVAFAKGADLFISDTQYTHLESIAREGWGHSSSIVALSLARRAKVRAFLLFHHEPEHSDAKLFENLEKTRAY
jgi:phosphoribosyl 1,2-cyclic phosphodiesterase